MKLSTGLVTYAVEFDNGDVASITFNPNDKGLQQRIKDFGGKVDEKIKKIELERTGAAHEAFKSVDISNVDALFDMSEEELTAAQKQFELVEALEAQFNSIIKEELNEVFRSDVASIAFKYVEPLSMVTLENGKRELYVMHFLREFGKEMRLQDEQNDEIVQKHIGKYIGK